MPAMITLKTFKSSNVSADIIFLIDTSGSMADNKIFLVKRSLKYIIEILVKY